jgi:guanylate kinase
MNARDNSGPGRNPDREGAGGPGSPPGARGMLLVLSAPSGAGKTTLVKALLAEDPGLRFSVSYTTRPPRAGEVDGRDYFFVDRSRFDAMVAGGEFLEHAEVFGNCYGTSRRQVEDLLAEGHHVLLEIDVQGAGQVRRNAPACTTVFIMPPSVPELERRLRGRGTDSEEVIRRRLAGSLAEMAHWREFDFVIFNEEIRESVAALRSILAGRGEAWSTARAEIRARAADLAQG